VQARAAQAGTATARPEADWTDAPYSDQIAVEGRFAGFKRFCPHCEGYYRSEHFLEDGVCRRAPRVDPADLLTVDDWREMAIRWADQAIGAMSLGTSNEAYWYARGAYRFCLRHQLAGGTPNAE
jgi:hypothetical protein